MGRHAKPINLHLLEGNKSRKTKAEIEDRQNAEELIKFESDNIVAPPFLSDQGAEIFDALVFEFNNTQLLKNVDTHLLAFFCDALDDYIRITDIIRMEGYVDAEGNAHALLTKKKHAFDQAMKVASQFGLSPTDRAKLAMNIINKDNNKGADNPFSGRV